MDRRRFLSTLAVAVPGAAIANRFDPLGHLGRVSTPSPAPRQLQTPVGIGTHDLDAATVARLRWLGARHVRYTIYWHHWGERAYRAQVIAGLDRLGDIHPLLLLHGGGDSLANFESFALDVARRWPHADLQLWNEVDVGFATSEGFFKRDPARYAAHLRSLVPRIRRVSQGRIVSSGIAGEPGPWLRALGDAPRDVDAVHCYGLPAVAAVKRKAIAHHKPLWVTEFGLEAAVIPAGWDRSRASADQHHLDAMRESVRWNDGAGHYERMYWHVLRQNGDTGYDLVRGNGSWRPAAEWLRANPHP